MTRLERTKILSDLNGIKIFVTTSLQITKKTRKKATSEMQHMKL